MYSCIFRRVAIACRDDGKTVPSDVDGSAMSASQSRAAELDQRIEHRLQIEGRAADHLEHVGGGGLLLQRFAQIIGACRSSLSRRVFSIAIAAWPGECRDQLDLLVGERANLLAEDTDGADQLALSEHRDRKQGPVAAELDGADEQRIAFDIGALSRDVGDMDHPLRLDDAASAVPGQDGSLRACGVRHTPPARCAAKRRETRRRRRGRACRTWPRRCAVAFARMAWNTGSSSPAKLEMTCRISLVAVCCSSASASSRLQAASCFSSVARDAAMAPSALSPCFGADERVDPGFCLSAACETRFTSCAQSIACTPAVAGCGSISKGSMPDRSGADDLAPSLRN